MTEYTIHPIVLGTKILDQTMMTYQYGFGKLCTIPIFSWLIKVSGTHILIDTGELQPIRSIDRERSIGGKIYTFEEGLKKEGLSPKDIDIVIHTHLHNDHCENDYKCENATFFIHQKELESIHAPHPLDYRYNEEFILDIEERNQIEVIDTDREIIPGISVLHTPAHTPGGLSVLIDTPEGKCVITGFCTIDENFDPPKEVRALELEVIPPGTHVNVYDAYEIMKRIREMADILVPLHEAKYASVESIGNRRNKNGKNRDVREA